MSSRKVLIVGDADTGAVIKSALAHAFECEMVGGVDAASALARSAADVVVADDCAGDVRGLDLLETIHAQSPGVPFILLGGAGDVDVATEAGRRGVFQFVPKPIDGLALARSVERAMSVRRQRLAKSANDVSPPGATIIGSSPSFKEALDAIDRAADSAAPLLMIGETGTGKDLLASRVHALGPRRHRPFVVLNAGALPPTLLDSELFGHVAGAFTGATRARRGLVVEADGGTLFLDEIADLPLEHQGRLLRLIENGQVRPVGADHERSVDVRIVAATHCDLASAVAQKRFREDLFYRLNVLAVRVPPLRERQGDLPPLIHHFYERARSRTTRPPALELTPEIYESLLDASWPGNVRELAAAVERLVVLGTLPPVETPRREAAVAVAVVSVDAPILTLRELSLRYVEQVLARTGGDKAKAVALLGIDISTLYRWQRRGRA